MILGPNLNPAISLSKLVKTGQALAVRKQKSECFTLLQSFSNWEENYFFSVP